MSGKGMLLALLLSACASVRGEEQPPNTAIVRIEGGGIVAPDSTVQVGTTVYVTNLTVNDTVNYTYFRRDSLLTTRRSQQLRDSIQTAAPAYGTTATYRGCAQIERGGRNSGVKFPATAPVCWQWTYARSSPLPTLDSVKQIVMTPATARVEATVTSIAPTAKNQIQWCVFAILKSGKRVKTQNSWNIPECEVPFQLFLAG